jgi:hypothetical protein
MRIALALIMLLLVPAGAHAASVAYVDNGEVWLSSLDGTQKVRLAMPVVNSDGDTEKWLAVAQADNGRIVAVRNKPGRIASFSWFKVWEPDGTSTVEGPLNAPPGWALYIYPLGFDLTADGKHMVYGYSNSGFCCPIPYARGTYVRPVTNSSLEPINLSGEEDPTIFGTRVIAHSGGIIDVQEPSTTYSNTFAGWVDISGIGLDLRRTDVAATGQLVAFEAEEWSDGTQTIGKIGVVSIAGVGQPVTFPAAVDCYMPASGVAVDVSLSQDGRSIAWSDGQGLKVTGTPTTAADPCVVPAPVVISATGKSASIGGADVTAFVPPVPPAPPAPPATPPEATPTTTVAAPVLTVPRKLTAKSLTKGFGVKVKVGAAGKVTITAKVKKRVIATGSATAKGAGTVTVKLKLNAAGRKVRKRLKGAKATLRVTHGGRSVTRTIKLR